MNEACEVRVPDASQSDLLRTARRPWHAPVMEEVLIGLTNGKQTQFPNESTSELGPS